MTDTKEVHFEGKIAQKAIIVKDGKVLLMRDPRYPGVIWEIPGGRMNINEVPQEALKREIFEELGVEVTVGDVVYMEQFLQGNESKRAFMIVYQTEMVDQTAEFVPDSAEVCEIAWCRAKTWHSIRYFQNLPAHLIVILRNTPCRVL